MNIPPGDFIPYSVPSYDHYGLDDIGFTNTGAVGYYMNRAYWGQMNPPQCGLVYQQRMYMNGCYGGASQYYGWPHGISMTIRATSVQVSRDTATASR
jgi:hypothetical protein